MEIDRYFRKVVVFDLDGTLCDGRHRQHLAQAGQWEQFHALLHLDALYDDVAALLIALSRTNRVVAVTNRPARYRSATEDWLAEKGVNQHIDEIYFRPDDDFSKNAELKLNVILGEIGKDDVWMVFEDQDRVVEALRNAGLTVLQPAPGGY